MRKFIFGLLALAIVVFGGVFYLLGRDYNKTLVKDNPNTVQSSSSVATSSESSSSSESVSSSSSSEVAVPSSLTLSGNEAEQFAEWVGNQAQKMNLVGSQIAFIAGAGVEGGQLMYHTVNGPIYLSGGNNGAGLQAEAIYGFYKWDATEEHGLAGHQQSQITDDTGYKPKKTVTLRAQDGYSGHLGDVNDIYIIANDGNIYELKINDAGIGGWWPNMPDQAQAAQNQNVAQITQDAAARAELSDLVGYDAEKVSQHFQYDN